MDWQCLQWGEQFSAGRLVGRIPSCSHWIIALNHSHVGRIPFWGSSQYCQTPAVAIEWYYARSEILFIEIPIWFLFFFSHPLQSPESQMTAVKPIPKSIIQYSAWCQDTSSYRVKIHSSDFALMQRCQDSTGYKDIQAYLQYALCRVTQVRRPNKLWLAEAQPPFFPLKVLVV